VDLVVLAEWDLLEEWALVDNLKTDLLECLQDKWECPLDKDKACLLIWADNKMVEILEISLEKILSRKVLKTDDHLTNQLHINISIIIS
jgi:hypothetical protein